MHPVEPQNISSNQIHDNVHQWFVPWRGIMYQIMSIWYPFPYCETLKKSPCWQSASWAARRIVPVHLHGPQSFGLGFQQIIKNVITSGSIHRPSKYHAYDKKIWSRSILVFGWSSVCPVVDLSNMNGEHPPNIHQASYKGTLGAWGGTA